MSNLYMQREDAPEISDYTQRRMLRDPSVQTMSRETTGQTMLRVPGHVLNQIPITSTPSIHTETVINDDYI